MKYTVGIDIALRKSGIIVLDENKNIIYKDVLVIKPKFEHIEAVQIIYNYFKDFKLPDDTTEVSWVIEDVLAMVHLKAALSIHAARTAATLGILNKSHTSNKDIVYYTPNAVKYWLTNKRGGSKDELLVGLKVKFPDYDYDSLTEDERDALALVLYHLKEVGIDTSTFISGIKRRRSSKRT